MAPRKKETEQNEPKGKQLVRVKGVMRNHTVHGIAFGDRGELEEGLAYALERAGLVEILKETSE